MLKGFIKFPEHLLEDLIEAGIDITIRKTEELGTYFDLNLMAKSHMYLYMNECSQWRVKMRYGEDLPVDTVEDLLTYAVEGMHHRSYINGNWDNLLKKRGYLGGTHAS